MDIEPAKVAAATYAVVKASERLLGPATDEVAEALRAWTAKRVGNVGRITANATAKVADPDSPASVPMRVWMGVLQEGSYSDNDVVVEYLGGVLASSRTADGVDDRGVAYSSLVTGMSSDELRFHYMIYRVFREVAVGSNAPDLPTLLSTQLFVPYSTIWVTMQLDDPEDSESRFEHCLYGLDRRGLIGDAWHYATDVSTYFPGADSPGLELGPSRAGADLFMWGLGRGQGGLMRLADPALDLEVHDVALRIPAGSKGRLFDGRVVEIAESS